MLKGDEITTKGLNVGGVAVEGADFVGDEGADGEIGYLLKEGDGIDSRTFDEVAQ